MATQVPLSRRFTNPRPGIFKAVGYLLRNGVISALRPSLSHLVDFGDVTGGKKTGITPA